MLKILQARLQPYMNGKLPMFNLVLEKAKKPEIQFPTFTGSSKSKRVPGKKKKIYCYFIDYAKAFDFVDHNQLENSERNGNIRSPDLPLEKPICRSESNS